MVLQIVTTEDLEGFSPQSLSELEGRMEAVEAALPAMQTQAGDLASQVDGLAGGLATATTQLSALASDVSGIAGQVDSLATGLAATDGNVSTLSVGAAAMGADVVTLQGGVSAIAGDVTAIQGAVSANASGIASLGARVTALEVDGGGGIGLPNVKDYGAVGDGIADDTAAFNAALAAGIAMFVPPGTYKLDGQVVGTIGGLYGLPNRRAATLLCNYTAGPQFLIGGIEERALEFQIESLYIIGVVGQTLIKTRWLRGLRVYNCRIEADQFLSMGDASLGVTKFHYICSLYDNQFNQVLNPTKHWIVAENFNGQFDYRDSFTEGRYTANLDGFRTTENIQQRIDHVIVKGGVFSRFRDNWSFVDGRVVNMVMHGHHSEGALRNAIRFETTASTAKDIGHVGWEAVRIVDCHIGSTAEGIYFGCSRPGLAHALVSVADCQFQMMTNSAVAFVFTDGQVDTVDIHGIAARFHQTGTNVDVVRLVGGLSDTLLAVVVDSVVAKAYGNALRSILRVEGNVTNVAYGNTFAGDNVSAMVSDVST